MALVREIDWVPKERNTLHAETSCHASSYEDAGQKVLQLDTHGSSTRKHVGKASQSLQFDRQGAEKLLELIGRVFPDLITKSP